MCAHIESVTANAGYRGIARRCKHARRNSARSTVQNNRSMIDDSDRYPESQRCRAESLPTRTRVAFRRTAPINGSRPRDYPCHRASSRVHCIGLFGAGAAEGEALHLATDEILPGARARTPTRIARQSRQRTKQTSTARINPLIRTTNGRFQRLDAASASSAPQSRLAIRPIAVRRRPATISI